MAKTRKAARRPAPARRPSTAKTTAPKPQYKGKDGKPLVGGQPTPRARQQSTGPLAVRATAVSLYQHKRRRIGDTFVLADVKDFNPKIHEWVDPSTPERVTTGREILQQQHDEILGKKYPGKGDSDDVL